MAAAGIPTPGEVFGVSPGQQVANGTPVPEYRKQLLAQGVPHPTSAGYAALSNMFGQIAQTADGLSDRLTGLYARNVQQQSAEAAQQDVSNAHDLADIQLPAGSSLSEEAYRRSAIVAAQSRLQVSAVQDVDALAEKYSGDPQAFQQALQANRDAAASELDDRLRPSVDDIYSRLGASAWRGIAENVRQLHVDEARAALGSSISTLTDKAANLARSGDQQGAMGIIEQLTTVLNKAGPLAAGGSGAVSYTQQAALVRGITEQVGQQYILGWVGRNPQAADTALHGGSTFATALGQSENGGNYGGAPNPKGYVGKYQFGEERLTQLGFYHPAADENLKENKWRGEFTGLPGVNSLQDFLHSPQAQEQAFQAHLQDIDKRIDADNLLARFGGQVRGGVPVTRDAIRAMAHLGGYAAAKSFLESDGRDNPNDGRTSLADYGKKFAQVDQGHEGIQQAGLEGTGDPKVDVILQNLPPERRDELMGTVDRQLRSIRAETAAQQQSQMVQDRVLLGQRAADQVAMLETGQQPTQLLTYEDVQKAYPDSFQAEQQWHEVQRKTAFAQNYGEVSRLTLPQQDALLATRQPDPASPRYAEQLTDYEGLQKAVAQNRQELATDPARALRETDPATRAAWDGVTNGAMPLAQAMRVTVAAQSARGLQPEQIKPLPNAQAAQVVQQFMQAPTTDEAMRGIYQITAGLGDPAMATATIQQLNEAKLPSGVSIAIDRLREGDENAARKIISAVRVKPGEMPNMGDVTLQKVNKAVDSSYSNLGISAVSAVAAQITGQPAYQDRTADERKLLQRLSQLDAASGTDPDTAASNAVETVFGKRGSIVEPEGIGAVSFPNDVSTSAMHRGLDNLRGSVDLSYLENPTRPAGMSEGDFAQFKNRRAELAHDVRTGGRWVDRGGGYSLVDPYSGSAIPGPDGRARVWSLLDVKNASLRAGADAGPEAPLGTGIP